MSSGDQNISIPEKHDGELTGRMDIRVLLRLLSCSMTIEKRLRRRFIEQFDTTLPRFDVLAALERNPDGVTMSELSRLLLVSNGNVTVLVRQLESDGYLSAEAPPEDKRRTIVMMTRKGREHFKLLAEAHHKWIGSMFRQMSAADMQSLHSLLANLKVSLAAEEETD
ncbi:MarR family winged helix-turn-helix transcriptional regulator [Novosphingobium cyanobacteriorum]|uniref:MarR family transcriptional regulator n=1 Tax=Novosphingobium cyanobacteriorum TaxID=3024215 RepID=A0ABT6CF17_9SPHN|nr:MarR family transcriptional regulator [Novosphingobium cyanobacteriorum]MDF8331923.1 MarR family transcriptional regulator [Novosphingobium cyanobacteriorum]